MPKYQPEEIEKKYRDYWEQAGIYKFNPASKKKVYSIDTPPPYASAGHLHVGHALHYTQFEIIARAMRQIGYEVYFAPGFDDNGLPTEKYVEEKLNINKSKTNRAEFRKLCLAESKKVEEIYKESVFKKLGHSYDWTLLYETISPQAQKVSQKAFLELVKKGDCYQKQEPTIWCPYHETALAQAEVEDLQRETTLNYIDFDIGNEKITIATTRPEFLPACVAVFVNPNDKKHKHLIGKEITIPLFNYKVKIMGDETVETDFGTGILMVCTFGDNADIEKYKKYHLDLRNILNKDGTLNELAGKYKGLSLKKAREQILDELKKQGRLKKQETIQQTVGACWRCSTPVEYIVTKQWFIKALDYKQDLIKRGRQIKWHPEFMRNRFEDWVNNLAWDWIISRQRYYGVPIPVWYCPSCQRVILPEEDELPIDPLETEKQCPSCNKPAKPEQDVFDTWMTSSNTPEIALRWLERPKQYEKLAPMSLRPQAQDIIRTWAFYTILKSHLLFNRIPWKDIMLGTFVLDSTGRGMSKSKGNVVWADELISKYGVDAFRYWVGSASIGSDISFKEQELIAGKKFLNKLYNAANFISSNIKDFDNKKPAKLEAIDKWLLQEVDKTAKEIKNHYMNYEIPSARRAAEKLFWHLFCDNYLEIIKDRIYNATGSKNQSAQYTLYHSLLTILKLFAPITPFITEELYHQIYKNKEKFSSIHITTWPDLKIKQDKKIEASGNLFLEILSNIRQEKSKNKKPMNAPIILKLEKKQQDKLKDMIDDLKAVTKADIETGKFHVKFKD
ncbi:MAG: valine--tRNA ligase [Candidatus Nanoarchaeia archaeon]